MRLIKEALIIKNENFAKELEKKKEIIDSLLYDKSKLMDERKKFKQIAEENQSYRKEYEQLSNRINHMLISNSHSDFSQGIASSVKVN